MNRLVALGVDGTLVVKNRLGEIGWKSVSWIDWVQIGNKGRGLLKAVNYLHV
jgi:hypothetical protein